MSAVQKRKPLDYFMTNGEVEDILAWDCIVELSSFSQMSLSSGKSLFKIIWTPNQDSSSTQCTLWIRVYTWIFYVTGIFVEYCVLDEAHDSLILYSFTNYYCSTSRLLPLLWLNFTISVEELGGIHLHFFSLLVSLPITPVNPHTDHNQTSKPCCKFFEGMLVTWRNGGLVIPANWFL